MALSGCADRGGSSEAGDEAPQGAGPQGEAGNGTQNGTAALNVTFAASPLEGQAPLTVAFWINGTYTGNDSVEWTFDADGDLAFDANGSALPANWTFTFESEAAYHAVVSVLAGGLNATHTWNITVAAPEPAGPPAMDPVSFTETVQVACNQCSSQGANTGVSYRTQQKGIDQTWVAIDPAWRGQPFTVTADKGNPDISFRTGCSELGSGGGQVQDFKAAGAESGTVPQGAVCVLMWQQAQTSTDTDITITIGA